MANQVINDKSVLPMCRFLMLYFLSKHAEWDGWRLPWVAHKFLKCSLKTAEKYVRILVDAGYLHKVAFRNAEGKILHRYKITEAKMPVNEPRKHTWIKDWHRQPINNRQQASSAKPRRGVIRNTPPVPRQEQEQAWQELNAQSRAARRSSFFGPEPLGKKFRANKGRSKKFLHSSETSNPLTPFSKEDSFDVENRGKRKSSSTPEPKKTKGAAAPAPVTRRAAAAAFDAAKRSSPWLQPKALDVVKVPRRAQDARLIETWGQRGGLHVEPADVESFLLHPVTGMLQVILDRDTWTYRDLSQWCRRVGRTISAEEVMTLYRALFADDGGNHGYIPGNVRDLLGSTHWRRRTSNPHAMMREHFAREFIPYDQCLQYARDIVADMPWHPADLLSIEDFN
jgi:hypothetical protein